MPHPFEAQQDGIGDWIAEVGLYDTLDETASEVSRIMSNRGVFYYRNYDHLREAVATVLADAVEEDGPNILPPGLLVDLMQFEFIETP